MVFSTIVAIFFRLLNFALLCAILVYIYKKYVYPLLNQNMHNEDEALKNLKSQKNTAINHYHSLEQQLHHDTALIIELKKKVAVWAEKELLQSKERDIYKDIFIKKLEASSETKQMRIAERMLEITSGPLIIAQAQQELAEYYQRDTKSQQYLQEIIDSLSQKRALP